MSEEKEYKIGDTWTAPDGKVYEIVLENKAYKCKGCDCHRERSCCIENRPFKCTYNRCILPTEWQDRDWALRQLLDGKELESKDGYIIKYEKRPNPFWMKHKNDSPFYVRMIDNDTQYRLHQPKQEPENDKAAEMCYKSNPSQVYWHREKKETGTINGLPIVSKNGIFPYPELTVKLKHNKEKTKFWFVEVDERGEEI
jgi:hypothetical protein